MSCNTVKVMWVICLEIAFPSKALLIVLFELHGGGQSHFQQMLTNGPSTLASWVQVLLTKSTSKIGSHILITLISFDTWLGYTASFSGVTIIPDWLEYFHSDTGSCFQYISHQVSSKSKDFFWSCFPAIENSGSRPQNALGLVGVHVPMYGLLQQVKEFLLPKVPLLSSL